MSTTKVESLTKLQQYGRAERVDTQVHACIRVYGPLIRDEIVERLDMFTSTVCGAIDRLKKRGLVVEDGTRFNENTRRNVKAYKATEINTH